MQYTGLGIRFGLILGIDPGRGEDVPRVSVAANLDQALAVAYRYSRIEAGMRRVHLQASLTAVVDRGMASQEEKTRFAVGMLKQGSVRVRRVEEWRTSQSR